MAKHAETKGPWTHRFLTALFSVVLALLCFWLLGFVVNDIGSWPGPAYGELEQGRLDQADARAGRALCVPRVLHTTLRGMRKMPRHPPQPAAELPQVR